MQAAQANQSTPSGQIVYGLLIVIITFIVGFTGEVLYTISGNAKSRFQTLIDYTASSEDMPLVIHQDASKYNDAKPIGLSMNERTGIEFSYSFYLIVYPSTFSGTATLKHVFHKGYGFPWPLLAPGVFIRGDTNTMTVMMNTYKNPYMYADVTNIPVSKWFHVVLNAYKGGLDIFVNGNLANRITFKDTLPYQNFQDLILFSNTNCNTLRGSGIPALVNPATGSQEDFQIEGSFKGQLSNLKYARYALSMNEIQALMNAGPSKTFKAKVNEMPPYTGDDWWTQQS
jgi:hypothetical protein